MNNEVNLIANIHTYLAEDIAQMNQLILEHLSSKESLVEAVGKYLIDAGGKRIRPILTILTSKMFGYNGKNHLKLAAAVEFIHAATLLHDDVVDESKERRFQPTANIVWGNKATILVGDFLFSQAFKLMVATESLASLQVLSLASSIIAEGEVTQLAKLNERRLLHEEEYNKIVYAKTAELFGAACEVGAITSDQSQEARAIMRQFGINLGFIFQISDDLLDYSGKKITMGKNIGDDFLEGKVTLPLIILYTKLTQQQKNWLDKLISLDARSVDDLIEVQKLLETYKIKEELTLTINKLKEQTYNMLQKIKIQNESKDYLASLLEFAVNRAY